jgi:hypothetical protein
MNPTTQTRRRTRMARFLIGVFALLGVSSTATTTQEAVAKQKTTPPSKNQQSLTTEQIDIYVLLLNKVLSEHNVNAVLVDHTEQLKLSEYDLKDACLSGIEIPSAEQRTFYAGSLGPEFIALIKPRLTHPSRLRPISPDDLSHLRETPFPKSEDGFTSGWLRLSEVVFDKGHQRAVMRFTFTCGGLCSTSRVLVFVRDGEHWKEKRDVLCQEWIS